MANAVSLPETGFLRLSQILGSPSTNTPPIIPVSKSTWWAGVKSGRFPQPVKLGPMTTAWRVEDIRSLISNVDAKKENADAQSQP
jgi:prophage regulatory protein